MPLRGVIARGLPTNCKKWEKWEGVKNGIFRVYIFCMNFVIFRLLAINYEL